MWLQMHGTHIGHLLLLPVSKDWSSNHIHSMHIVIHLLSIHTIEHVECRKRDHLRKVHISTNSGTLSTIISASDSFHHRDSGFTEEEEEEHDDY